MKDAWKFDFNLGLLGQLKSVRVVYVSYTRFWKICNGDILVIIYFTYISRDYIGIIQQFILLVYLLWCLLSCIFGTVLNYRALIKKNLYINVLFCTPGKTFSSKNGKYKKKKNRENNKTRAICYIAGLYSLINLVNPRLAIEVMSDFQAWITKDSPKIRWRRQSQVFAGHLCRDYGTLTENLRWYNVELLLQKQVLRCKHV